MGAQPRLHVVDETSTLSDFVKQSTGQATAKHMIDDVEGFTIRMGTWQTTAAEHEMHLLCLIAKVKVRPHLMWRLAKRRS